MPAGISKPKAGDVATLAIGEFYACHGREIHRTYVQPGWMKATDARDVAAGALSIDEVEKPQRLERAPAPPPRTQRQKEPTQRHRRAVAAETQPTHKESENAMSGQQDILSQIQALLAKAGGTSTHPPAPPPEAAGGDAEAVYQYVRRRLLADPQVLKVLATKPEIVVEEERVTVEVDASSVKGRVAKLLATNWFKGTTQRHADIKRELERTGTSINNKSLSVVLAELVRTGFLTDEGASGYKPVEGMKARVVAKKSA
jgi:hypothetical protein